MKCQLSIANDTELEIENYSSQNVENDFVIVTKDGEELPIENAVYSNVRIIINTNIAQFQGTIRLKGWPTAEVKSEKLSSGLYYPKCTNNTLIVRNYGNETVNYYLQQGRSLYYYNNYMT